MTLKFEVDIQSQSKVRVQKPKKSNMAARRPFWKWHRWKSIGFCLWPPSTCIWNLKLKFQSKLDLCSGNHVVYRQTDGQTDKVNPVYPPSNFVGQGYNNIRISVESGSVQPHIHNGTCVTVCVYGLTHWPLGDEVAISKVSSFNTCYGLRSWALVELFAGECHRTSLIIDLVQVIAWCCQASSH